MAGVSVPSAARVRGSSRRPEPGFRWRGAGPFRLGEVTLPHPKYPSQTRDGGEERWMSATRHETGVSTTGQLRFSVLYTYGNFIHLVNHDSTRTSTPWRYKKSSKSAIYSRVERYVEDGRRPRAGDTPLPPPRERRAGCPRPPGRSHSADVGRPQLTRYPPHHPPTNHSALAGTLPPQGTLPAVL